MEREASATDRWRGAAWAMPFLSCEGVTILDTCSSTGYCKARRAMHPLVRDEGLFRKLERASLDRFPDRAWLHALHAVLLRRHQYPNMWQVNRAGGSLCDVLTRGAQRRGGNPGAEYGDIFPPVISRTRLAV